MVDSAAQSENQSGSRAPEERTWGPVTVWQCPFCPRDGEDKTAIEAHIDFAHPEPGQSVTDAINAEQAAAAESAAPAAPIATATTDASAPAPVAAPANSASSDDTSEKGE